MCSARNAGTKLNAMVNAMVNATAARGVGTSRRAPLDALLQGFGKVLVEKE